MIILSDWGNGSHGWVFKVTLLNKCLFILNISWLAEGGDVSLTAVYLVPCHSA
jgi:hypothetical protein